MKSQQKLSDLCQDLFILGMQIGAAAVQLPDCETLRRQVLGLFESFQARANKEGFAGADIEDAVYAIAAYLDEVIQFSNWAQKQAWTHNPLQAILFGESIAGINFYERLARARRRSPEVLEIYYFCIMLGFEGKFRMGGGQDLEELVDDLRREIGRGEGKVLSKHGTAPSDGSRGGRGIPFLALAGGCLALAVLIVGVLYLLLHSNRSETLELLQQLTRI